jgi:N-acetyl-gamma-glutamyl-phosphate reductase
MHIYSHAAAAIVGVTGYTGRELDRLLSRHPNIRVAGRFDSTFTLDQLRNTRADVVVFATEHHVSLSLVPQVIDLNYRVLDMSGAFRLSDPKLYPDWYGFQHTAPGLLQQAVYGLPEFHAGRIEGARLVANPGCYATAALLALRPVFQAGLIEASGVVVVDGKSGISGAGRQPKMQTHFCEVSENIAAYGVLRHRHTPEMVAQLPCTNFDRFVFTPHLIPISRGILNTAVFRHAGGGAVREALSDAYASKPFIRVFDAGHMPDVHSVVRTNMCHIGIASSGSNTVIVATIDNLMKGAAGQAVQNLNLMFGYSPDAGLLP